MEAKAKKRSKPKAKSKAAPKRKAVKAKKPAAPRKKKKANAAQFRVQHLARTPKGSKVRSIKKAGHVVRVAFPAKKGKGRVVEILHPKAERNPSGCLDALQAGVQAAGVPESKADLAIIVGSAKNLLIHGPQGGREAMANPACWDKFKAQVTGFLNKVTSAASAAQRSNPDDRRAKYDAIRGALQHGKPIRLATAYKIIPLSSPDHVRMTSRGDVQVATGRKWVFLTRPQIDDLASQAGMKITYSWDRNPSKRNLDEIGAVTRLSEEFHGGPVKVKAGSEPFDNYPDDFAGLGLFQGGVFQKLSSEVILDPVEVAEYVNSRYLNKKVPSRPDWNEVARHFGEKWPVLDFRGTETLLGADASGTQLYVLGGDQELSPAVFDAFEVDANRDKIALGRWICVIYATKKTQDGNKLTDYYHILGEEGGEMPLAVYNRRQQRLEFVGGTYHLKEAAAGIVN